MNTLDLLADAISTLENYGDHHEWCAQRIHGRSEPDVCDCGFAIKLVVLREHRDRIEAQLSREPGEEG